MSTFPVPLPLGGARVRIEPGTTADEARLIRIADDVQAGSCRMRREADTLFIDSLVVEPGLRGYGLGSEAATLLRGAVEASDATLLRATAPPDLGLAVYFWSRMGFHPLHGPGPGGGIWMERGLGGTPIASATRGESPSAGAPDARR